MRLWTTQTQEVLDTVMRDGFCVCNPSKSSLLKDDNGKTNTAFALAYSWLIMKMDKKIKRPEGLTLVSPWWAYYKVDGKDTITLPDIDYLDSPGEERVAIELEIPDEEVLLSDLDLWHHVLNNSWIDDSNNAEEWEKCNEYFKGLPQQIAERVKVESWDKIFDLTPMSSDWREQGMNVQATFWVLRKEYIVSATSFTVRDISTVTED